MTKLEEILIDVQQGSMSTDTAYAEITVMLKSSAVSALTALTPEHRLEVFGMFNTRCGDKDPLCRCWDDS